MDKTRIGFELESFATSSEAVLGVSSCGKPSLPLERRGKKSDSEAHAPVGAHAGGVQCTVIDRDTETSSNDDVNVVWRPRGPELELVMLPFV